MSSTLPNGAGSEEPDGAPAPRSRAHRPATSALSVADAAALRRLGLEAVGFVLGTVVLQVASSVGAGTVGGPYGTQGWYGGTGAAGASGFTSYPCVHVMGFGADHWGFNAEDRSYAASVGSGYATAVARLTEEARSLGAHGVVGIQMDVGDFVGGWSTWTFRATGTAVVIRGAQAPHEPFTTNVNGTHLERLVALGLAPARLVSGVGACYVRPNCRTRGDLMAPGGVDQIPQAVGVARNRARATVREAASHSGEGVVQTDWTDRRLPAWGEGWIQSAVALGTAVRRFGPRQVPAAPRAVVPLRP
ncbi:MAG: heavy metal-binding domain-containing protein [Actinomycetota bacterium]|nr:heavy metal-binding domain-containing protein [Actinomycetota bacterium]